MRSLLWLLAVFAAAVALVILGRVDAGYVLFIYPPYRVEVSILFFAIALVAGFFLLYGVLRLLGQAVSLPAYVRAYRARRRRERAHAALAGALKAYYEGRHAARRKGGVARFRERSASRPCRRFWPRARRTSCANSSAETAGSSAPKSADERLRSACLVTRAELALEDRDFNAAREALRSLHDAGPKHIAATRMLLRAERGAGAWDEVLRLATQLGKRDAITPALAEEYKVQATVELLARAAGDAELFQRRWREVEARDQLHPRVAAAAARHATTLGPRVHGARHHRARARGRVVAAAGGAVRRAARGHGARKASVPRPPRASSTRKAGSSSAAATPSSSRRWAAYAARHGSGARRRAFSRRACRSRRVAAAHLELARLAERLGQPSEAQTHYRRAAEIS